MSTRTVYKCAEPHTTKTMSSQNIFSITSRQWLEAPLRSIYNYEKKKIVKVCCKFVILQAAVFSKSRGKKQFDAKFIDLVETYLGFLYKIF